MKCRYIIEIKIYSVCNNCIVQYYYTCRFPNPVCFQETNLLFNFVFSLCVFSNACLTYLNAFPNIQGHVPHIMFKCECERQVHTVQPYQDNFAIFVHTKNRTCRRCDNKETVFCQPLQMHISVQLADTDTQLNVFYFPHAPIYNKHIEFQQVLKRHAQLVYQAQPIAESLNRPYVSWFYFSNIVASSHRHLKGVDETDVYRSMSTV